MPQMLACRWNAYGGNTQIQPLRNNNGSFTAFGNPYTPASLGTNVTGHVKQNLVVQFGDEFYCSGGREIRVYNPSTGNWDVDVANTGVHGNNDAGLYIGRGPTGAPRLALLNRNVSNRLHVHTLDTPGGAWNAPVDSGIGASSQTWPGISGLVYNNTLFLGDRGYVVSYGFASEAFARQQIVTTVSHDGPQAFCRAGARLFMYSYPTSSAANYGRIYEYIGGSFVIVFDGTATQVLPRLGSAGANSQCEVMFFDEASASLIVVAYQDTATVSTISPGTGPGDSNPGGNGLHIVQVPIATFTEVNLTGTVPPIGTRSPGALDPVGDVRLCVEVDTDTNPLVPVTYIWYCVAHGAWARFQWNGVGSIMTVLGSGGDRGIALSHNPNGGGQYFLDPTTTISPTYHIEEVQARVPITNGTRVFLRGYQIDETGGVPTPSDETVGLYWGLADQTPNNLATISNAVKVSGPGTAPILAGNKFTNFTFDGTTIYSVDWDAVGSDGLANQQQHMLMPHVEV